MSTTVGSFDQLTNDTKTLYPNKRVEVMINQNTKFRRWLSSAIPKGATWTKGGILKYGANTKAPMNVGMIADGDAVALFETALPGIDISKDSMP